MPQMFNSLFSEQVHPVIGIAPIANAFAGTVHSQAVNSANYNRIAFLYEKAVGATGTATITVEACTAADGTGATAIPFYVRKYEGTGAQADLPTSDPTLVASTGFTTTAGSNMTYVVEAASQAEWNVSNDKDLGTYKYLRLTSVEVAASAVLGGVYILCCGPRYAGTAVPSSVIV